MGEERVATIIARLEQALVRLETAVSPPSSLTLFENRSSSGLHDRHQALRGKVEDAIARIDSLLGSAERS